MMKNKNVVKTMLALICLCAALSAQAETSAPANYAVLSVIGEKITFNVYKTTTGTMTQPVRKMTMDISNSVFDDGALWGAKEALKQWQPEAVETDLTTGNPALYKMRGAAFDSGSEGQAARDAIHALLKDVPANYLILITKYRNRVDLQLPDWEKTEYISSATLEGLGFYVDQKQALRSKTGRGLTGFFTSYAYIKASLLDAKTLEIIREKSYYHADAMLNDDLEMNPASGLPEEVVEKSLLKLVRVSAFNVVSDLLNSTTPVN